MTRSENVREVKGKRNRIEKQIIRVEDTIIELDQSRPEARHSQLKPTLVTK